MERIPLIGITLDHDDERTNYKLPYHYVDSVTRAGGAAVLLPFGEGVDTAVQLAAVDGLLLTGGNDLNPAAWGEARHPAAKPVDPRREAHERALLAEAERRGVPVLAVCFGMQVMNAARGGSLVQHLPDVPGRDPHNKGDEGGWRRHEVTVEPGSRLAEICGAGTMEVNTSHHQCAARVGGGLRVTAVAPDGTIEALEDPARPLWLGVQWHPERMTREDPRQAALFRRLVEEAARRQ